ncbi:hypothetical protein DFJ73DRAFT_662462 [Zopfochytrium polystomum]|nr:hypothetical protein DFJ73DRAFT_662462 [Zopfochytrium polystomum]
MEVDAPIAASAAEEAVRSLSTVSRWPSLPTHVLVTVCRCLDGPRERFRLASLLRLRPLQLAALYDLNCKAFDVASALGDVKSLDALLRFERIRRKKDTPSRYREQPFSFAAILNASRNGHVRVLQWWKDCELGHYFDTFPYYMTTRPMDVASENGHVAVLQWWKDHCSDKRISAFGSPHCAMTNAADEGHVEVLQWWKDSGLELREKRYPYYLPRSRRRSHSNCDKVIHPINLDTPSARGHVAVLQWVRDSGLPHTHSHRAVDDASKSGKVEVLEWWKISGLEFQHTPDAIDEASANGDLAVLDWWKAQTKLKPKHSVRAVDVASRKGLLTVLDWWLHQRGSLKLKYSAAAVDDATKAGRIDVLQWWADSGLELKFSRFVLDDASASGHAGHVDVLDWWRAESGLPVRYSACAVDGASKNGHVHVLQWWRDSGLEIKFSPKKVVALVAKDPLGAVADWWRASGINVKGLGAALGSNTR